MVVIPAIDLPTISLLRPIVVAAGTNYSMLDPSLKLREPLRRGWNFELESGREQLNGLDKDDLPADWDRKERYGERRYWLVDAEHNSPPLSEVKLAEGVLAAVGDGSMGKTVYRFTSSFIQTQAHAFTMFLPALDQYDEQTPYAVPLASRSTT